MLTPIEHLLDEIQGFLKPGPGEPSMFEEHLRERERERRAREESGGDRLAREDNAAMFSMQMR